MRYLKSAFSHIPDQVLSTFIIWGLCFIWYRGFKSIIADPPSADTILWVIFIGMGLGAIVARTQMGQRNEKNPKVPQLGK